MFSKKLQPHEIETYPVPMMGGGWVLVGCTSVNPGVRSVLSNRFRYVLLPSILTKPSPPTAEVNMTSPPPEFRDTLTLSPKRIETKIINCQILITEEKFNLFVKIFKLFLCWKKMLKMHKFPYIVQKLIRN